MGKFGESKSWIPEDERTVRIFLFGPLRIENKYGVVEENMHRQVGYWQLLKYLLITPLRTVREEDALHHIWVDEFNEEDILSARVRVTRLRNALKPLHLDTLRNGLVLSGQGQFLINPSYDLELDVYAFDALMELITVTDANDPRGLQFCEKALKTYRGKILANTSETEWLRPFREKYQAAFETLAWETLHRIIALGNDGPLRLLCQRSAFIAPEAEELHRSILRYLDENNKELQKLRHEFQLSSAGGTGPAWIKSMKAEN